MTCIARKCLQLKIGGKAIVYYTDSHCPWTERKVSITICRVLGDCICAHVDTRCTPDGTREFDAVRVIVTDVFADINIHPKCMRF